MTEPSDVPFDTERLDTLLAAADADAVLASSKFNVQYLLGGYRFFFFENMDAIGVSRYLPLLGYVRGRPDAAFYIGAGNEDWGTNAWDMWVGEIRNTTWTSVEAAALAAESLRHRGLGTSTVAVESSFIPADAMDELRRALPEVTFVDAHRLLEELRAVKTDHELDLISAASEKIIASFLATFDTVTPGMTKHEIGEVLRQEETREGLVFDYALVTCGTDFNRAPHRHQVWQPGESLSLDSGGMLQGYIGDLARVGIAGEPSPVQVELLAELEEVQQAARSAITPGEPGRVIFDHALRTRSEMPHVDDIRFVAHAMGLISHEAPRLTDTGPVPYPADHADTPLAPGMVLSIEAWTEHPEAGFIKLEDTVIVTDDGWRAPGDRGRSWNRCGAGRAGASGAG